MMMQHSRIKHFLLVVDRLSSTGIESCEFSDPAEATAAYRLAEETYSSHPGFDVVLIGSDSIETVQRTHGSYFPDREVLPRISALVETERSLDATEFEADRQRWLDAVDKLVATKQA